MNKGTIQTAIQLFDQIMTGNMILIDFYIQNYPQTLIELTDILISTNQLEEMLAYYPQMNEFIQNKNIKINDYSSMIFKSKNRDMIHDMDHIILPSALSFKLIEKESSEIRILLEKLLIASVSIDIELDKLNCFLKSDYVETINVILEWRSTMVSELDYPHFFTLLERISHLEIHPFINQFINTLFCFKESRTVQFEDSWQNYLNSSVSVKEEYKSQTLNWFLLEFLQSLNNHQIQHYTIMSSLVYAMSNAFIDEKTKSHWKFEKQGFIDLLPSLDCTRKWNILDSLVCLLYAEFEKEIDCENDYNEKKTAKLIHLFACIVEGSDKFQWLNSNHLTEDGFHSTFGRIIKMLQKSLQLSNFPMMNALMHFIGALSYTERTLYFILDPAHNLFQLLVNILSISTHDSKSLQLNVSSIDIKSNIFILLLVISTTSKSTQPLTLQFNSQIILLIHPIIRHGLNSTLAFTKNENIFQMYDNACAILTSISTLHFKSISSFNAIVNRIPCAAFPMMTTAILQNNVVKNWAKNKTLLPGILKITTDCLKSETFCKSLAGRKGVLVIIEGICGMDLNSMRENSWFVDEMTQFYTQIERVNFGKFVVGDLSWIGVKLSLQKYCTFVRNNQGRENKDERLVLKKVDDLTEIFESSKLWN